ncbi:MAG: hypothetical protein Q7T03_09380 [Deltaproteobacteria bacterium]|nr:hypothetical protein [Deltaproteobacteria bacterium]
MKKIFWLILGILVITSPAFAEPSTQCTLKFDMTTRPMFFTRGKGTGTITCDSGETANIIVRAYGGWVTLFQKKGIDGNGTFSKVEDISKLYGSYTDSQTTAGHSGALVKTPIVWKRNISLQFSGTPKGWNPGASMGEFRILPAEKK